jgi:hypothetical protein
MHTDFLCILYYTIFALHVSGAICTHHQEHKLQSTVVGTCDCVLEVGQSIGAGCGRDTLTLTTWSIDHAVSVRISQPQPAPVDYPTFNTPQQSRVPMALL